MATKQNEPYFRFLKAIYFEEQSILHRVYHSYSNLRFNIYNLSKDVNFSIRKMGLVFIDTFSAPLATEQFKIPTLHIINTDICSNHG